MTLFTNSSWSLFWGASSAGGRDGLHGAAWSDPSTGYIYKRDRPVEMGAAFTFEGRKDLCFISLHFMNLKLKKKIIQRGTAWVFLSLKLSKLLPSSKSANSMQKVALCRQDVLKARASFTLTRWWKGRVCQMFHVGKEFRRKMTHIHGRFAMRPNAGGQRIID